MPYVSSILFWLKIGGVAIVAFVALGVVNNYTSMSGTIAEQAAQIKRLEGRLTGAYMRIDRRDQAVNALPDKCKAMALEWIKTGDIPAPFNPFAQDNQR